MVLILFCLEDAARQKAELTQGHNWNEIKNLPKPNQLIFETGKVRIDGPTYINKKKYALENRSIFRSTYVGLREQLFSNMNYEKQILHTSHL